MAIKKIFKKEEDEKPVLSKKEIKEGTCVECGDELAPGQTYVCKAHVRAG